MSFKKYLVVILMLAGGFITAPALAHKVNVFAYAEQGEVYVEGYFVDGKKAQNSKVEVFSPGGKLLLEGVTNDEGQYRFPVPQKTDLKIVVNAGMGHQNEFMLSADELGGAPGNAVVDSTAETGGEPRVSAEPADTGAADVAASLSGRELEAVVSKAVNEAIKPLVRELAASQEKASLTGIVGGVGYIIGFLGLFAYFKARQDSQNK